MGDLSPMVKPLMALLGQSLLAVGTKGAQDLNGLVALHPELLVEKLDDEGIGLRSLGAFQDTESVPTGFLARELRALFSPGKFDDALARSVRDETFHPNHSVALFLVGDGHYRSRAFGLSFIVQLPTLFFSPAQVL